MLNLTDRLLPRRWIALFLGSCFLGSQVGLGDVEAGDVEAGDAEGGHANVVVSVDGEFNSNATADFDFGNVAGPVSDDAGNIATFRVLSGRVDGNSGGLATLRDGALPNSEDQPSANFFFGTGRGQVLVDFTKPINLKEVRSYSWHRDTRAAQSYSLYVPRANALADPGENSTAIAGESLANQWRELADVETRSAVPHASQVAVRIADADREAMATTQFVLLEIRSNGAVRFPHTFFSEIDFVDGNSYPPAEDRTPSPVVDQLVIDKKYTLRFDTTEVPDLTQWVRSKLMPACEKWYPEIVKQLASDSFEAPTDFSITFRKEMSGVAYTRGKNVVGAGPWYRRNLEGEAVGSIIHELVHVVQQYPGGRNRPPSWLVEGIADQVRWYQFEPIDRRRKLQWAQADYDDAYFASATFLNTIIVNLDPDALRSINAACREGRYTPDYWQRKYGKSAAQIWEMAKPKEPLDPEMR